MPSSRPGRGATAGVTCRRQGPPRLAGDDKPGGAGRSERAGMICRLLLCPSPRRSCPGRCFHSLQSCLRHYHVLLGFIIFFSPFGRGERSCWNNGAPLWPWPEPQRKEAPRHTPLYEPAPSKETGADVNLRDNKKDVEQEYQAAASLSPPPPAKSQAGPQQHRGLRSLSGYSRLFEPRR